MEKRYQVFISSTFQDLQNARQEVSQALLRADCFPAGMELFPAADEEQFEFIKTIIDQWDYYIIISAGRYGSIHPETGLSYTEMEYDYAMEIGKPVIRLLHKDPKSLADEGDDKLVKLLEFQMKLKRGRLVAFWGSPDQLGKEVAYALMSIKKSKPATGWVRADGIATSDATIEIERLHRKLAELELELERSSSSVDIEGVFSQFTTELVLKLEHLDDNDEREITATDEFKIREAEVAEFACIATLSNTSVWNIRDFIEIQLAAACKAGGNYRVIWPQSFDFRVLLRHLEAEKVLYSQVTSEEFSPVRDGNLWHIEDDVRPAIARLEISRSKAPIEIEFAP